MTPMEIGTSMLVRPRRNAAQAERKKGWPAKMIAGIAMAAEIQWNRPRVLPSAPDQTLTDNSITFMPAKAATASGASSGLTCDSERAKAPLRGCASKPIRASSSTRSRAFNPAS